MQIEIISGHGYISYYSVEHVLRNTPTANITFGVFQLVNITLLTIPHNGYPNLCVFPYQPQVSLRTGSLPVRCFQRLILDPCFIQ